MYFTSDTFLHFAKVWLTRIPQLILLTHLMLYSMSPHSFVGNLFSHQRHSWPHTHADYLLDSNLFQRVFLIDPLFLFGHSDPARRIRSTRNTTNWRWVWINNTAGKSKNSVSLIQLLTNPLTQQHQYMNKSMCIHTWDTLGFHSTVSMYLWFLRERRLVADRLTYGGLSTDWLRWLNFTAGWLSWWLNGRLNESKSDDKYKSWSPSKLYLLMF